MSSWDPDGAGVVVFPSGRTARGRALRRPIPPGPEAEFGLYLLAREPQPVPWAHCWLRWPDFRLPSDADVASAALAEIWRRSANERVEIACAGGRGRTGTALACLAILDGIPASRAVEYVREHYHRRAVETPWRRRFVARFPP